MPQPFWGTNGVVLVPPAKWSSWDKVELGGRPLPGLCKLTGGGVEHIIDKQGARGQQGARTSIDGTKLAEFEIEITIWTEEQWNEFQSIITALKGKPGKGLPEPQPIKHPSPNAYGIDKVSVIYIGFPEDGKIENTKTIKLKCLQWVKKPKATGTIKPKNATSTLPRTRYDNRNTAWSNEYQERVGHSVDPKDIPPPPPSFLDVKPDV